MPTFTYKGSLLDGSSITGEIDAADKSEAKNLLLKKRTQVLAIRPKSIEISIPTFNKVSIQHLAEFTRQLAAMNSAGLPLIQCLDTIAKQTENKILYKSIREISGAVQAGSTLADAMQKHTPIFNPLYCAMIKAGEAGGILENILTRLADYLEKTAELRKKIKSALTYPAVVAIVAIGALIALMTFVVPTFAEMLQNLGAELPASTLMVIAISDFLRQWLPLVFLLGVILYALAIISYRKNPSFEKLIDSIKLKLPLYGNLLRKSAVSRFSRTLGALLSGGVTLTNGLEITAKTAGNRIIEEGILKTLESIKSGKGMAEPLEETGVFPPMVIQMISVGEKTGDLPVMLSKVSDYYDKEVDSAVTGLISIIEPVLIVVMGIIIAGVLISMYLPMFDMISGMG